MTDRVRTLTVTLDRDFRTDDIETIIGWLKGVKYVADVQLGPVVEMGDHIARQEFRQRTLGDVAKVLRLYASGGNGSDEAQVENAGGCSKTE